MLKKNLVMTLASVVIVGVVAISIYNSTTITQSNNSYKKGKYMNNTVLSIPYIHKDDNYKNLVLLSDKIETNISNIEASDEKISNSEFDNNNNTNKQKDVVSKSNKTNSNINTNKKKNTTSKSYKTNTNTNANKQTNTVSKSDDLNSNSNTDKQTNSTSGSENLNNDVNVDKQVNIISESENSNINTNTEEQTSDSSSPKVEIPTIHYDRTTSIYENDNKTLIRVEYYVNNKLTYYSSVEEFDVTTNSYVEKIYNCNQTLIRTDIYSNGKLIKSY